MSLTYTIKQKDVLVKMIKDANQSYREGEPDMTDAEYDALVDKLREIDPENEWFGAIEPSPVSSSRKRKLPIPMRSLNKVKNLVELEAWVKALSISQRSHVVCMPKFDGGSLLSDELNQKAYSRGGDENEGQDCTAHAIAGLMFPTRFSCAYSFGEFVIKNSNWDEYFKGQISPYSGEPYKSPRNTACGFLNRDVPAEEIKHATFYRYGIDQGSLKGFKTYHEVISSLCNHYLQEHLYRVMRLTDLTEECLYDMYSEWSKIYPIDGVVVYLDDLSVWESIGRHQTSGNPLYAVAYKHPSFTEAFTTKVTGVNWKVSKAGALKPVVQIEPVDTGDCIMENPTGYNAGWIMDHNIAKGSEIIVTRSGGVIPKILTTSIPAPQENMSAMWDELAECPSCGGLTVWSSSAIEMLCTNYHCCGRVLAKIVFFYATCGAENMGEETIKKIFDAGFKTLEATLNITFDELMNIEGIGECAANIILSNNKKIKEGLELPLFMHASDCFVGIGQSKAEKIIGEILSPEDQDKLYQCSLEPKIGKTITMTSFYSGLRDFYNIAQSTGIPIIKPKATRIVSGRFIGKTACFSGFRDKDLEEKFISQGGKISCSVSKKTDFLVIKSKSESSSKISKAQILKVNIVEAVDFGNMLG